MTNWKTYKVGDLYSVASGLSKSRSEFGFGYPFVTFKDVFYNFFIPAELGNLANTTEKERKTCSVKCGDIFLTRTSETMHELGMSAVALKDYENATFNGFTKRLRLKEKATVEIDPVFIGYYFRTTHIRNQIGMHATMTTRASLNSTAINSIEITIPEIEVQKRIGEILKSIDDKIGLNRRMNQTLEQMAQTLFRQYFVDGIDEENLPEGWREGKLNEVLELFYGKALKQGDRKGGDFPVVGSSGIVGYHNTFIADGKGIVVGRKGNAGAVIWLDEQFYPIDTTYYVVDQQQVEDLYFHYFLLKSLPLAGMNSDSAVPGLNRNHAYNIDIIIPNRENITDFNSKVKPLFDQKFTKDKEINTLTTLRDTLLPKLMSGEIDVMQTQAADMHEPVLS